MRARSFRIRWITVNLKPRRSEISERRGFVFVKFSDFLVSENKMSRKNHVDKVDNVQNPAPADEKEHKEYYDVKYALRSEHNRKPYKTFYNPTDNGYY